MYKCWDFIYNKIYQKYSFILIEGDLQWRVISRIYVKEKDKNIWLTYYKLLNIPMTVSVNNKFRIIVKLVLKK